MTYETSFSQVPFVYEALPTRVVFGSGTRSALPAEVERLGIARALILHGQSHAAVHRELKQALGERYAGAFDGARMHTPVDVTETAMKRVAELNIDGIVAVGGGSTTGLAKAIALRTDLPQVVLPTTYAGSEMTPILGQTHDGIKTTQRSLKVLPEVVIYDVDLTMDLPTGLSGVSGMNAMAHAVEALYAREANPVICALALQSVRALARALPAIGADPGNRQARTDALYGAWLAGICLGSVGMALHHKLCHTLGGSFDLPHAQTHALVLPHALAYNAPAVPQVMAQLCDALGVERDAPAALQAINRAIGAPAGLAALGMPQEGITRAVDRVLANPYWNPRALARDGLTQLITDAFRGAEPRTYR